MNKIPALFFVRLQLFAPVFCLFLSGCVTTSPANNIAPILPPGYAIFDMPGVYSEGMAKIEAAPRGVRVQLLETFEGSFELHPRGEKRVIIRNDQMGYSELKRFFSGDGTLIGDGRAEGEAEIWLDLFGPVRRDHRKGPWTLRPATPAEIETHENKLRQLEERKRRAGMLDPTAE